MKKALLFVVLLATSNAYAQGPANSWYDAYIVAGPPIAIASDMTQSVYALNGSYLTKYSLLGAQQWRASMRTAAGFALAPSGTSYVAGTLDSYGIPFGNGVSLAGTATGTLAGYLVSFNAQGGAQWARQLPTLPTPSVAGSLSNFAVAVDEPRGMIYTAGKFANNYALSQTTASGAAGWLVQATGAGELIGEAVAVDPTTGDLYVTGSVRGSVQLGAYSLTGSGTGLDGFVARITAQGVVAWAHIVGGAAGDDLATHLLTDPAGNAYVAGYFTTSGTFGPGATGPLVSSGGTQNIFVASYSAQGALRWVQRAGGGSNTRVKGLNYEGTGPIMLSVAPLAQTYTYGTATVLNAPASQAQTLLVLKLDVQNGSLLPGIQQQPLNTMNSNLFYPDMFPSCVLASATSTAVYLGGAYNGQYNLAGIMLPRLIDMGYASAFVRLGSMAVNNTLAASKQGLSRSILSVFPLPVSAGNGVKVQFSARATELRLINSLGQLVHVQPSLANVSEYTLPTVGLMPGRYTLQVLGSEGISTRAIVVE